LSHEVVLPNRFGPANRLLPFNGSESHLGLTAPTSSAVGCIRTGGSRTICSSVANWAMALTNSKNCVAHDRVYESGILD
jgi:hypothetical protein